MTQSEGRRIPGFLHLLMYLRLGAAEGGNLEAVESTDRKSLSKACSLQSKS
jgi:hypothetical protein